MEISLQSNAGPKAGMAAWKGRSTAGKLEGKTS
jgi:hypothetical protein